MSGTLRLRGSTSGYAELQAAAVAGDQTFILPAVGGTLLTTDSPVGNLTLELGSASQPSLRFEGDTDTGLFSSGANTLNLVTGGSNKLVLGATAHTIFSGANGAVRALDIDSSGRLLVGTSNARSLNDATQLLQVEVADGSGSGRIAIGTNNNDNATGAGIYLFRSRGGTLGSNTSVQEDDDLGSIYFHGADGTDVNSRAAQIRCEVDGTPGSNDMPGRLVFSTTPDGDNSPDPRMTIDSVGNVGVGETDPSARVHSIGTGTAPSFLASGSAQDYCVPDGEAMQIGHWNSSTTTMTTRLHVTSGGNVGIGNTNPQRRLVVSNDGAEGFEFFAGDADGGNTLNHYNRGGAGAFINSKINADQHIFGRADGEKIRIDSGGRLLINTNTSVGYDNYLQVVGDDADKSAATFWRSSDNNGNPSLSFVKTRGTVANPTAVNDGDVIGHLRFNGHDGTTDDSRSAQIETRVDGTPGTGVPGRLSFLTGASSDPATTLTEQFRINSKGQTYNVRSFNSTDISSGKTLNELPYTGNSVKRLYFYSTNKTASVNTYEAVFKISFTGGQADLAHFKISGSTLNQVSTAGNIGYSYCNFTFSSGNGTTPYLNKHETVVDARSYNSGFCEPLLDGTDVWIFIKSNSSSSSARLDLRNIQIEVETQQPSAYTIYSVSGTPAANSVSDPEVVTGHRFNNNISIDGAIQNFMRSGAASFAGASTTGNFTVTVSGLRTLTGSNWFKCGLFVGFSGIRQNASNNQIALYYFGIRGLSTWSNLDSNSIVGSITTSITASDASSFTMTFEPTSTSSYGSVFAIAQGNGASPEISIVG